MFFGLPKNLVDFFRNFEIPQIIVINLVSEESPSSGVEKTVQRFICNSVILAIHSEKFQKIIAAGTDEINLKSFSNPGGVEVVRHCIEFMYGERLAVHRVDDVIGMCKFADIWEISSLWVACLKRISFDLSVRPFTLFYYCELLSIVTEQNWQHDELWREFDKTARENADRLIEHVMGLPDLQDIDDRICRGLIKNSKTAVCGAFIMSLLKNGDSSKKFVVQNIQLIPVATAFADEDQFLLFKNLFLPSERCRLIPTITVQFYESHPQERSGVSVCPSSDKATCAADYNEDGPEKGGTITHYDRESTSKLIIPFSLENRAKPNKPEVDVRKINVISDRLPTETGDEKVKQPSKTASKMEKIRKRLFTSKYKIPLGQYPALLKEFPLYTGLDIVGHFISESDSLNQYNLMNLLASYYADHRIPESILDDIKAVALLKCSQARMVKSLDDDLQGVAVYDRIESFALTKTFFDIPKFCDQLENDNMINMKSDEVIPCPIIYCDADDENHALGVYEIDFSSESRVKFTATIENHNENIIHCYMLGMKSSGTLLSYIPILQLTVPEIIQFIVSNDSLEVVQVIIVFSTMMLIENLESFDNVLVKCLQKHFISDGTNKIDTQLQAPLEDTDFAETSKEDSASEAERVQIRKLLLTGNVTSEVVGMYPLYVGLELVAMNLSRSSHDTLIKLKPLLLSYFNNPLIPLTIVEDLKSLANFSLMNTTLTRKKKKKKIIPSYYSVSDVSLVPGRLQVLSLTCKFYDIREFLRELSENKRIIMHFNLPVLCPICPTGAGYQCHFYKDINIDFSSGVSIDFTSVNGDIHKDRILHCYALQLGKNDEVISYVSVAQLTIHEIDELLRLKGIFSIKMIVLVSKTGLDFFKNVFVHQPSQKNSNKIIHDLRSNSGNNTDNTNESIPDSNASTSAGTIQFELRNCSESIRNDHLVTYPLSLTEHINSIRRYSRFTRLDILGLRFSKERFKPSHIRKAISPFLSNRYIPVCILKDFGDIALQSVREDIRHHDKFVASFAIPLVKNRDEAFRFVKTNTCAEFCQELVSRKQIRLSSPSFNVLIIDMSSSDAVKFCSDPNFCKDHIVHCYILMTNKDGTVVAFISIMLLKVDEIVELVMNKMKSDTDIVKTVVVLSKSFLTITDS